MKILGLFLLKSLLYAAQKCHHNISSDILQLDLQMAYCNGVLLREVAISELQNAMSNGSLSAVELTQCYIKRIDKIDPFLNSVIEINPDALEIAAKLDQERKEHRIRGPLHGIPILLKDNIATHDKMHTTAGSLAMVNATPTHDARIVSKLRRAGLILLGKTNLSEWSGARSYEQTCGWSARGGQCRNPYVLSVNPLGSSTGSAVAVAANLVPVAIGTETDGSIIAPASRSSCIGIKPTVHLVSQDGVIPISEKQDCVGVFSRTVKDALAVLKVIIENPQEMKRVPEHWPKSHPVFQVAQKHPIRVGIPHTNYWRNNISMPELRKLNKVMEVFRTAGVVIQEQVEIPIDIIGNQEIIDKESELIVSQLKSQINNYFSEYIDSKRKHSDGIYSFDDIIRFNKKNADKEMNLFDQNFFLSAQNVTAKKEKLAMHEHSRFINTIREKLLNTALDRYELDVLFLPPIYQHAIVHLPAIAGYPVIVVPSGFDEQHVPFGTIFTGKPLSEPILFHLAQILEDKLQAREPPVYRKCCTNDDIPTI